ncbi:MAG TPA: XRE family transcriptional regulator [Flavobacteriales bacterium]|nr:XRE family transcriptional regulator [Flavobacteriales bacterium]
MKKKKCTACSKTRNIVNFNKRAASKDKHASQCRDCTRVKKRESYYKHHRVALLRTSRYKKKIAEEFRQLKSHVRTNEHDVIEIKDLIEQGNLLQQEIADKFGVSLVQISRIKNGKNVP